jgi:hypothetical protein
MTYPKFLLLTMVKVPVNVPDTVVQNKKRKKNAWVKEVLKTKKKNKISFKDALLMSSNIRKNKKTN